MPLNPGIALLTQAAQAAAASTDTVRARAAAVPLDDVLLPLTAALALALVVERVVEFLKNLADAGPSIAAAAVVGTEVRRADDELAKLEAFEAAADRDETTDSEIPEGLPAETILVQEATDPDDGTVMRAFVIQAIALVAGIVAARLTGLQLFSAFNVAIGKEADFLLTGLFIGGGSGPAHVLIRFITQRKFSVAREAPDRAESDVALATAAAAEDGAPAVATARPMPVVAARALAAPATNVDVTLDIPYAGGVDREKLEYVHRRATKGAAPRNPSLIVFHHTAMKLSSSFDDVVRVIKSRTSNVRNPDGTTRKVNWITGYHCVVTRDGLIHPFCRWDRYGNHAVGYNVQSLGIALTGNFETNPKVPYSNYDGRDGPALPTIAQLDGAARVIALWLHLYPDIPFTFPEPPAGSSTFGGAAVTGIIPHKYVSPDGKTCPGNQFPYAELKKFVSYYREMWGASPAARERIETFKRRPYLYVDDNIPATTWPPVPARLAQYPAPSWTVTRVGG